MQALSAIRGRVADKILQTLDDINDVVEDVQSEAGRQRQWQRAQNHVADQMSQLGLDFFSEPETQRDASTQGPQHPLPVPPNSGQWVQAPAARIGGSGIGGYDSEGRLIGIEEISSAQGGQRTVEQQQHVLDAPVKGLTPDEFGDAQTCQDSVEPHHALDASHRSVGVAQTCEDSVEPHHALDASHRSVTVGEDSGAAQHRGVSLDEAGVAPRPNPIRGASTPESGISKMGSVEVVEPNPLRRLNSHDMARHSSSDSVPSTCAPGSSASSSSPACYASPSSTVPYKYPASAPAERASSNLSTPGSCSSYLASYPAELPSDPLSSIGSKGSAKSHQRASSMGSLSKGSADDMNDFEWSQDVAMECPPESPLRTSGAENGVSSSRRLVPTTEVPKLPYGVSGNLDQSGRDLNYSTGSRAQNLLTRLIAHDPRNAQCCTCFRPGVTHASTSLAALFCNGCAAEHCKLGSTATLRPLDSDWTEEEIQELMEGGNSKLWESSTPTMRERDAQSGYQECFSSGISSIPGSGLDHSRQSVQQHSTATPQPRVPDAEPQSFMIRGEALDLAIGRYQQSPVQHSDGYKQHASSSTGSAPVTAPPAHEQKQKQISFAYTHEEYFNYEYKPAAAAAPAAKAKQVEVEVINKVNANIASSSTPQRHPPAQRSDSSWLAPEPRVYEGVALGGSSCRSPSNSTASAASPAHQMPSSKQFPRSGTSVAEPSMDSWIATMTRR